MVITYQHKKRPEFIPAFLIRVFRWYKWVCAVLCNSLLGLRDLAADPGKGLLQAFNERL